MIKVDLWSKDMQAAADAAMRDCPLEKEDTISWADQICASTIVFRGHWEMERTNVPVVLDDDIEWDKIPFDDPEWVYALNRHSIFVVLGQAWRYTHNTKYALTFVRMMRHWIKNVPFTDEAKNTTWRSIETGLRSVNWLKALALFADCNLVDEALRQQIEDSLRVHAGWLIEAHKPFQKLSNWGVLQDNGLFVLGMALYEPSWCVLAIERLTEEMHHQVMADGTHWEQSPMYHCEVLACCLNVVLVARNQGYTLSASFLDATQRMALALAYMVMPNGLLLCQGDSDEIDARDLLVLAAILFKSSELKAYAGDRFFVENYWDVFENISEYALLQCEKKKGSVALPDSGNYQLWSEPQNEESDFLHFHCGVLGSGHGHADLLHIDLVSHGEHILVDPGRYTYVDNPLRIGLKSAKSHNTFVLDNRDFTTCESTWKTVQIAEPIKGTYKFTDKIDYVDGAHLGYIDKGAFCRRRVLRLGQNLWMLWDTVRGMPLQPYQYEGFYHLGPGAGVSLDGHKIDFYGDKAGAQFCFLGQELQLQTETVAYSKEYNLLESCTRISVKSHFEGFGSVCCVIATGAKDKVVPVTAQWKQVTLVPDMENQPAETAQAVEIVHGQERWTVLVCHNEAISSVNFLQTGNHYGYGKVLVFHNEEKGCCLAW